MTMIFAIFLCTADIGCQHLGGVGTHFVNNQATEVFADRPTCERYLDELSLRQNGFRCLGHSVEAWQ